MKKTFLAITALAAMLFAGCTSSDELTTLESIKTADNTPTPVQFGTYMGKTRAGITGAISSAGTLYVSDGDATTDKANGFGVFGYLTSSALATSGSPLAYNVDIAPNFMYNQQVKANSATPTSWTYLPLKYWPNGEDANNSTPSNTATQQSAQYLSFFAYAPYVPVTVGTGAVTGTNTWGITALTANSATTNPTVSYTLDKTNFVDLLWGVRSYSSESDKYGQSAGTESAPTADGAGYYYNVNLVKQNLAETIDFTFKHALAKIGGYDNSFQVVCDIDGNGSSSAGYGSKADATFITVTSVNIRNKAGSYVKSGQFDIVQGKWTPSSPVSVTEGELINISSPAIHGNIIENTVTYESGWKINGVAKSGVTTSPSNLFATAAPAAYFIPGGSMDLLITITYVVRTADSNLSTGYSEVTQTITNSVNLSSLATPNKYYKILVHLGLTEVKFSAAVADWEAASGAIDKEIWLPSNVVSGS